MPDSYSYKIILHWNSGSVLAYLTGPPGCQRRVLRAWDVVGQVGVHGMVKEGSLGTERAQTTPLWKVQPWSKKHRGSVEFSAVGNYYQRV